MDVEIRIVKLVKVVLNRTVFDEGKRKKASLESGHRRKE
jgi:hypothetical protein